MSEKQDMWTAEDVAQHHRITVGTVWKYCRMYQKGLKGGWPHQRISRSIRFTESDLEAIDQLTKPQPVEDKARKTKRRSLAA